MLCFFFFFKQKTAYELRISDWSSDACSSDLQRHQGTGGALRSRHLAVAGGARVVCRLDDPRAVVALSLPGGSGIGDRDDFPFLGPRRSEEHTSELQSLMRISYAVFCLKKKNKNQ